MRNTAKGATGHITSIAAVFLACGLLAAATLGCGLTAGQNAGPDTKDEMRSQPDPSLRHQEAKRTMLEATNRHRAQAGAPPLRPGLNPAAQLHAEAALVGCYAGHWDRWGLKPGHRYALAGGEGAQGENAAGSDYCIRPRDRQPSLNSLEDEAERTVQKWMESEGHRLTLLDPAYTVMHAGIAHDQSNLVMIQQLSSEYVKHTEERAVSPAGILTLRGTVTGATLEIGDRAAMTVHHDFPPSPLTQGQMADTYGLCPSLKVAYLAPPLPGGRRYEEPQVRTQKETLNRCTNPHMVDPDTPPPYSVEEAVRRWEQAKANSLKTYTAAIRMRRVTADRMELEDGRFVIQADLSEVFTEHGPGIYTLKLWGRPRHMDQPTVISERVVFWHTLPPAGNPYGR